MTNPAPFIVFEQTDIDPRPVPVRNFADMSDAVNWAAQFAAPHWWVKQSNKVVFSHRNPW